MRPITASLWFPYFRMPDSFLFLGDQYVQKAVFRWHSAFWFATEDQGCFIGLEPLRILLSDPKPNKSDRISTAIHAFIMNIVLICILQVQPVLFLLKIRLHVKS